jgi:hypothetical protein
MVEYLCLRIGKNPRDLTIYDFDSEVGNGICPGIP